MLERAAAERSQRLQELLEVATPAVAAAAGQTAAIDQVQAPPSAAVAPPPQAPGATTADEREPTLGDFDETFTWSAEVLAKEGRRPDEVSVEEITWLTRLRQGLDKTRRGVINQLKAAIGQGPLDGDAVMTLEALLLQADVGVQATDQVLEALRKRLNEVVVEPEEGIRFLKQQLRNLLDTPIQASGAALLAPERGHLNVWLMVGVNGVGKTTTLGKLANLAVRSGYSCLIAAADTFRAEIGRAHV